MKKLIRITTVPESLGVLLKGQLKYMTDFFDVIGISSPGKRLEEVSEFEVIRTISVKMTRQITPFKDLVSLFRLIKIFIKEKPDIVHTHTPKAGLLGMLAARITNIPIRIHTVAGLPLMVASGFKKKLLVFIEKLTYSCSTMVYPNSENLKNYIIENGFTKPRKLKVIGNGSSNGIDTNFFKVRDEIIEKGQKIKLELQIHDQAFIFLFVGRIVEDKGVNELVEAFEFLHQDYPESRLLLVGSFENDLNPVKAKTSEIINSNKQIIHVGFQKDVRPFFSIADVFVFPSYREGFPNVVLQAGAMGVPSVVSNINGSNEIIKQHINGIILSSITASEIYESMKKMLTDSGFRLKLKENCRNEIVSKYERSFIQKELLNEYEILLKNV